MSSSPPFSEKNVQLYINDVAVDSMHHSNCVIMHAFVWDRHKAAISVQKCARSSKNYPLQNI